MLCTRKTIMLSESVAFIALPYLGTSIGCPRQQVSDTFHGIICDTSEHGEQVCLRVQAIQFSRADQAVNCSRTFSAGIGTSKQIILPSRCDHTQCPFGRVIVNLKKAVIAIADECWPASERVVDRPRCLRLRDSFVSDSLNQFCNAVSRGRDRVCRSRCRSSGERPRISLSMAYREPIRSSASVVIGEACASCRSKNLRRT